MITLWSTERVNIFTCKNRQKLINWTTTKKALYQPPIWIECMSIRVKKPIKRGLIIHDQTSL